MALNISQGLRTLRATFIILCGIGLSACSSNPLGMSDAEWERLSPEQQLEARARQAELDEAAADRRARIEQAKREEEARARAEYQQRRADARRGDIIQCVIEPAEGYLRSSWREAEPVAFELLRDYPIEFSVIEKTSSGRSNSHVTGAAYFDGQTVGICRSLGDAQQRAQQCSRMIATTNEYFRGIRRTIEVDRVTRGELRCDAPRIGTVR
ncbi:MAG: hypothetical protein JJU10_00420 [Idiomarina sp.]|nr:hypothetical protein [Idiomarina sp.]